MKRLLLTLGVALGFGWALLPTEQNVAWAQNTTCSDRPATDVSNACANTRFTRGAITTNCIVFTDTTKGCVPASGGGTLTFLRADGTFAVVAAGGGSAIVGMVLPWTGASVPDTYLLAYGQAVSRTTYVDLMSVVTYRPTISCTSGSPAVTVSADIADRVPLGAVIEATACFTAGTVLASKSSTTLTFNHNAGATTSANAVIFPFGAGDGSTTFNLPNLMGRALVGRDNMSGSAAGVLTTTYYGTNPDAIGARGGAETVTLFTTNLPPYTPSGSFGGSVNIINGAITVAGTAGTFFPTSASGNSLSNSSPGGVWGTTGDITASQAPSSGSLSGTTWTGDAQGGISTPFARVQPSFTVDWIIKALPDSAVGDSITVGVTNVAGGVTTNILYNNAGKVGEYALATKAQMYAATAADKIVTPSVIYPTETTTTYGATTTFDFSTFKNTKVTLTGDITTQTLTNIVEGKAGMITFIQDGSGNHTTVWNSIFKFSGGTAPTLTTTAAAVDILTYSCRTTTFCAASLLTDVK